MHVPNFPFLSFPCTILYMADLPYAGSSVDADANDDRLPVMRHEDLRRTKWLKTVIMVGWRQASRHAS